MKAIVLALVTAFCALAAPSPDPPIASTAQFRVMRNDGGSLTVALGDGWAKQGQLYDGRQPVTAAGAQGDAGVCLAGAEPLLRQEDWRTACVFTAPAGVDRGFNAMLALVRPSRDFFAETTFHNIAVHCFLDAAGYPQGWFHTQNHREPSPTLEFAPRVRAAYDGQDSFTFEFSAAAQQLTLRFRNGSAEARCVLDARDVRDAPRPWFIAYGTPNLAYCGPPRWTIHAATLEIPSPRLPVAPSPPRSSLLPPPKEVTWTGPTSRFLLDPSVGLDAGKQSESPAARSFREQIAAKTGLKLGSAGSRRILVGEPGRGHRALDGFCRRSDLAPPDNPEGYTLVVRPDTIAVVGASPAGTFYGVQTLVQMITRGSDGGWRVPGASIRDWPDFPFRGIYMERPDLDLVREASRLKLNVVIFGNFVDIDKPAALTEARALFARCRELSIEPVPTLQGFGHGDDVIRHNPNWAEGIWVQKEPITFGRGPNAPAVSLAHRNVIRTATTSPVVTDEGGDRYLEGRDYRLVAGEIDPYGKPGRPFALRRLATGRIPDGGTVLISYDYAPFREEERHDLSFCPREPAAYAWLDRIVARTLRELRPRYLMIGRDEPFRMSSDSRCLRSGKRNAELFAGDVQRMVRSATTADPKIEVLMWADPVLPTQGAFAFPENPTGPAIDLLPRRTILMPWFYGNFEQGLMDESVAFLREKGFRVIGGASRHERNPGHWSAVAWRYRGRERGALGLLLTPWENAGASLLEFAARAWAHAGS